MGKRNADPFSDKAWMQRLMEDDSPCRTCVKREQCATEQVACEDYRVYVKTNKVKNKSREPTRRQYNRIFNGEALEVLDWS